MDGDANADILLNDNGAAAVWDNFRILDFQSSTFDTVLPITPNANPNGPVWDLL